MNQDTTNETSLQSGSKPNQESDHTDGRTDTEVFGTEVFATEANLNLETETNLEAITGPPDTLPSTERAPEQAISFTEIQKQHIEKKIIKSTKGFFRSLKTNLIILSCFLLGSLLTLEGITTMRTVILIMAIIEFLVLAMDIRRARERFIDLPKLRLGLKLITRASFLDSLSRCLGFTLFYSVEMIDGFFYTLAFGPIAIASLIVISTNILKSCHVRSFFIFLGRN